MQLLILSQVLTYQMAGNENISKQTNNLLH